MNDSERTDVDEAVELVSYRPEWAEQGTELTQVISRLMGKTVSDVQHVGSTAVPGLPAKPILDIGVALPQPQWPLAIEVLTEQGFTDLGEAGVVGRRYLRRRDVLPAANVHLLEPDGHLWANNLILRQYLRAHPEAAMRYAIAKVDAARHHPTLLEYSAAKDEVIHQLLAEAPDRLRNDQGEPW